MEIMLIYDGYLIPNTHCPHKGEQLFWKLDTGVNIYRATCPNNHTIKHFPKDIKGITFVERQNELV